MLNIVPALKWARMDATQRRAVFYAACKAFSARPCPVSRAGYARATPQLFPGLSLSAPPRCSAICNGAGAPPYKPPRSRSDFPSGFCVRAENPRKAPSS
nr:MAG TPA: hypothetical protein [Caudoviricetes sp.]